MEVQAKLISIDIKYCCKSKVSINTSLGSHTEIPLPEIYFLYRGDVKKCCHFYLWILFFIESNSNISFKLNQGSYPNSILLEIAEFFVRKNYSFFWSGVYEQCFIVVIGIFVMKERKVLITHIVHKYILYTNVLVQNVYMAMQQNRYEKSPFLTFELHLHTQFLVTFVSVTFLCYEHDTHSSL